MELKRIKKKIHDIEKSLPFTPCDIEGIINKNNALYTMIIGERSNGKSYGALQYALLDYHETKHPFAYVRRVDKSIKKNPIAKLFAPLVSNGIIEMITDGEYTGVDSKSGDVYFTKAGDDDKKIWSPEPFCYCYALNTVDSTRGGRRPDIDIIIYDEFIPLNSPYGYIDPVCETDYFKNTISNIMGYRVPRDIIMVANTIDPHSCYFQNMGITNVANMKPGQIDLYTYGDGGTIAVAMTSGTSGGKPSDVVYGFDGESAMITGGKEIWDFDRFPIFDRKYAYKPKDIVFSFLILFDKSIVLADVVMVNDALFMYFAQKTTELKNPDTDIIYSDKYDPRPNWFRSFRDNKSRAGRLICELYDAGKCYYSSSFVGDLVQSFIIRS